MFRKTVLLVCVASLLVTSLNLALAEDNSAYFKAIDKRIEQIEAKAGSYDPGSLNKKQHAAMVTYINETVKSLGKWISAHPTDWDAEWRLGNVWRFGHNLDMDAAWAKSEVHLKNAIKLRPKEPNPYMLLATLYVNSSPEKCPDAEKLLKTAIEISKPKPQPRAYRSLIFAYYYQGKFEQAKESADTYLKSDPNDEHVQSLKKTIQSVIDKRSGKPK